MYDVYINGKHGHNQVIYNCFLPDFCNSNRLERARCQLMFLYVTTYIIITKTVRDMDKFQARQTEQQIEITHQKYKLVGRVRTVCGSENQMANFYLYRDTCELEWCRNGVNLRQYLHSIRKYTEFY